MTEYTNPGGQERITLTSVYVRPTIHEIFVQTMRSFGSKCIVFSVIAITSKIHLEINPIWPFSLGEYKKYVLLSD